MLGQESSAVDQAIAGEMRLLDPRVRTSPALAGELLHPGFVEVGRSGRRWDREAMLAELPAMPGAADQERVQVTDMAGALLAPGVVHLTCVTERGGRRVLRSSLWCENDRSRWRMYYHQGTRAARTPGGD